MHASTERAGHTVNQLIGVIRKMRVSCTSYAQDELDDGTRPMEEAKRLLKQAGAGILGSGAYSIAVAHRNPNKVIKITLSAVDGYHDYVDYIKKNKGRLPRRVARHLPKLYGSTTHGMVRVTVIERLEENAYCTLPASYDKLSDALTEATPEGIVMDLHGGNVMMRGNVPVIIDPWAHGG